MAPFICGAVVADGPLFPGETWRGTMMVDESVCPDAVYSAVTMLSECLIVSGSCPVCAACPLAPFVLPSNPFDHATSCAGPGVQGRQRLFDMGGNIANIATRGEESAPGKKHYDLLSVWCGG